MAETSPTVAVYHGGRHILATGSAVVTYGAPPLAVTIGSDVLIVPLDLYVPLQRADGAIIGGRSGPNSVAPDAPMSAEIGGCMVSVSLRPVDPAERSVQAPAFAGRIGPTSWNLTWEVWQDAPGMAVPAAPEPEWHLPVVVVPEAPMPNIWETPAHLLNPVVPV